MPKRCNDVVNQAGEHIGWLVHCPACCAAGHGSVHLFSAKMATGTPGWSFDGNYERPTFAPSMLARYRIADVEHVCHSFVRDGRIEYLSDCSHAMAGRTIDLPEEWT